MKDRCGRFALRLTLAGTLLIAVQVIGPAICGLCIVAWHLAYVWHPHLLIQGAGRTSKRIGKEKKS